MKQREEEMKEVLQRAMDEAIKKLQKNYGRIWKIVITFQQGYHITQLQKSRTSLEGEWGNERMINKRSKTYREQGIGVQVYIIKSQQSSQDSDRYEKRARQAVLFTIKKYFSGKK